MRNVFIIIATLLLVVATFLFLYTLADLFSIPMLKVIFSAFVVLLEKTPLAPLTRLGASIHGSVPLVILFMAASVLMAGCLYLEYLALFGIWVPFQRMPVEIKADALYRQGKYRKALRLYEKIGRWDRAAEIYRMGKEYYKAASMYEKLGEENMTLAAEIHEQMGDMDQARRCWIAAARYYASRQDWEKSAAFYLKGGQKGGALESYERQFKDIQSVCGPEQLKDKTRRIIQMAEQTGDLLKAASYCELSRDIPAAVGYYVRSGNFVKAATLQLTEGNVDGALQTLGRVKPGDKQYEESQLLLAKVLYRKEKFTDALRRYLDYFKKVKVTEENLEDFFQMGICLERLGRLKQARDVYIRIHSMHAYYMNVDERMEAIDHKSEETSHMSDLLDKDTASKEQGIPEAFLIKVGERYGDLEELGRGGAGIVYRANDKLLDRVVALKQLPESLTSNAARLQSFFKEARAVARMNHPNIVTIFDIMKAENKYYLVMEFIDGTTVEKLVEGKGALSLKLALYISRYTLAALSYAHRCGVVHQDIKPANIMLTKERTVKLTDFGIAHVRDELPDHSTDIVVGTPKYISPEQLQGVPVDERCDIYSFGVTLYEMATGNLPFPSEGILHHHLVTPPTPPRVHTPALPEEMERVILKCLEKNREDRYEGVTALLADLKIISRKTRRKKK